MLIVVCGVVTVWGAILRTCDKGIAFKLLKLHVKGIKY